MPETIDAGLTAHPPKNRILIRQDAAKDRVGSGLLYAPEGSETWPSIGTVVEIGPQTEPIDVQVGDRVLFKRQPSSALVQDRREVTYSNPEWLDLLMLKSENIVAVLTNEYEPGVNAAPGCEGTEHDAWVSLYRKES